MTLLGTPSLRPLGRGQIVLAAFPFADLSSTKRRPAVIVGIDGTQGDFILAFITSQQTASTGTDEVALPLSHSEFAMTGLTVPSKIRTGKLATLAPILLTRRLGNLGPLLTAALDRALITALSINTSPDKEDGRQTERERLIKLFLVSGTGAVLSDLNLPSS